MRMIRSPKSLIMCCALVAVFALNQQVAQAAEITISGTTTGTFCDPASCPTLLGLSFQGMNFSKEISTGEILVLDLTPSFTLAPTIGNYSGLFTLYLTFTMPTGVKPGTFKDILVFGSVVTAAEGTVVIDFVPTLNDFSFVTESGPGQFSLSINPVVIKLSGTHEPIPEPTTLLLLGTGLAGVIAKVRSRRKLKLDDNV